MDHSLAASLTILCISASAGATESTSQSGPKACVQVQTSHQCPNAQQLTAALNDLAMSCAAAQSLVWQVSTRSERDQLVVELVDTRGKRRMSRNIALDEDCDAVAQLVGLMVQTQFLQLNVQAQQSQRVPPPTIPSPKQVAIAKTEKQRGTRESEQPRGAIADDGSKHDISLAMTAAAVGHSASEKPGAEFAVTTDWSRAVGSLGFGSTFAWRHRVILGETPNRTRMDGGSISVRAFLGRDWMVSRMLYGLASGVDFLRVSALDADRPKDRWRPVEFSSAFVAYDRALFAESRWWLRFELSAGLYWRRYRFTLDQSETIGRSPTARITAGLGLLWSPCCETCCEKKLGLR